MTHRQHCAWVAWLSMKDVQPSLSDWYVMQETVEVRRLNYILGGKCPDLKPKDFLLKLEEPARMTDEDHRARIKHEMAMFKAWAEASLVRKRMLEEQARRRQKGKGAADAPAQAGQGGVPPPARRTAGASSGTGRVPQPAGKQARTVPVKRRRCSDDGSIDA